MMTFILLHTDAMDVAFRGVGTTKHDHLQGEGSYRDGVGQILRSRRGKRA